MGLCVACYAVNEFLELDTVVYVRYWKYRIRSTASIRFIRERFV